MRLVCFLVSDDIRLELGNKVTVAGVLSEGITVQQPAGGPPATWPLVLRLGFYARLRLEKADFTPESFALSIKHDGAMLGRLEGGVNLQDRERPITLALTVPQVPVPRPGILTFALRFEGQSKIVEVDLPDASLHVTLV